MPQKYFNSIFFRIDYNSFISQSQTLAIIKIEIQNGTKYNQPKPLTILKEPNIPAKAKDDKVVFFHKTNFSGFE